MANPPAAQPPSTIGNWTEGDLATQEATWVASQYQRLLLKRFWTATVTAVNHAANPMQVQVVMDGDSNSSGAWINVAGFNYYPLQGDIVVGVWYDDQQGWVLFPKIEQGRLTSAAYRIGAVIPAAGFSIIGMDTIDPVGDSMGIFNVALGGFIISVPGNYDVRARASSAFSSTNRMMVSVYQNGIEVRRGTDIQSVNNGGMVSVHLRCNSGDRVQLGVYLGATNALEVGANSICRLEATWAP